MKTFDQRIEWQHVDRPRGPIRMWVCATDDPRVRLAELIARIPSPFPTQGWRMYPTDLRCPKCQEINLPDRQPLVELIDGRIVCGMCGQSSSRATGVNRAGSLRPSSPTPAATR